jgi:hypothetical protein
MNKMLIVISLLAVHTHHFACQPPVLTPEEQEAEKDLCQAVNACCPTKYHQAFRTHKEQISEEMCGRSLITVFRHCMTSGKLTALVQENLKQGGSQHIEKAIDFKPAHSNAQAEFMGFEPTMLGHLARQKGIRDTATYTQDIEATVKKLVEQYNISTVNRAIERALLDTAWTGNVAVAKALIQQGANPHAVVQTGPNPYAPFDEKEYYCAITAKDVAATKKKTHEERRSQSFNALYKHTFFHYCSAKMLALKKFLSIGDAAKTEEKMAYHKAKIDESMATFTESTRIVEAMDSMLTLFNKSKEQTATSGQ